MLRTQSDGQEVSSTFLWVKRHLYTYSLSMFLLFGAGWLVACGGLRRGPNDADVGAVLAMG